MLREPCAYFCSHGVNFFSLKIKKIKINLRAKGVASYVRAL
jgi:hypothetical protein